MVTTYPEPIRVYLFITSKVDLDLDLESFARDLDLSDLQCLLAEDSSGDEDEYFDLENFFYRNQVEEERELLNKLKKRVVDLRDRY